MLIKKFAAVAICFLIAGSAFAQQATSDLTDSAAKESATAVASDVLKVMLDEEGALVGNAFVSDSEDEVAANVKVSLSVDGKVVDTVETNESGNFVFANVAPGAYQVLGTGDGLVGSQSFDVVGFTDSVAASPCSLGMCGASSDVVYDTCGSAPVESFSSAPCSTCNACSSCGGGLGGGFGGGGGGLGGRLGGGGFFSRPGRLLAVGGLIGGLAAIDGDDASPDQ